MAGPYIDPLWLGESEHAEYIRDNADISAYRDAVDRKIEAVCGFKGVRIDAIPVDDVTGFTTSRPLQTYGIAVYMVKIFGGYRAKRKGSGDDTYGTLRDMWIDEMMDAKDDLTPESITGIFNDDGDPKSSEALAQAVAIG